MSNTDRQQARRRITRNVHVDAWLTPNERQLLETLADRWGTSLSETIRRALVKAFADVQDAPNGVGFDRALK